MHSTMAVKGREQHALSTQLYTSARFVVIIPYLDPSVSAINAHFSRGSFFIHSEKHFTDLPPLRLLVTRAGSPSIGSKPCGSSSRATTGFLRTSSICVTPLVSIAKGRLLA